MLRAKARSKFLQFRFARRLHDDGRKVVQQTVLFDAASGKTQPMRSKEGSEDYRYFPDPDLLPVRTAALVAKVKPQVPELPHEKRARFEQDYGCSAYDAGVLASEKELAAWYEAAVAADTKVPAKKIANWVINDLFGRLNKEDKDIGHSPVSARQLGAILDLIADGTISGKIAKDLFEIVWTEGGDPAEIVEKRGLRQVTDTGAIEKAVDDIIAERISIDEAIFALLSRPFRAENT